MLPSTSQTVPILDYMSRWSLTRSGGGHPRAQEVLLAIQRAALDLEREGSSAGSYLMSAEDFWHVAGRARSVPLLERVDEVDARQPVLVVVVPVPVLGRARRRI